MSKSFPPTFSSAVKVTPTHSPLSTISKDSEPFFQPTSTERTGQDSSALLHQLSSQLRANLPQRESSPKRTVSDFSATKYPSTSQLASDRPRLDSSQNALGLTPLLSSISRPANFHLTGTDLKLQSALVPTPLPPGISLPASLYLTDLLLTDLSLQFLPTPALLICTDKGRTVLLVAVLGLVVSSPTDHQ